MVLGCGAAGTAGAGVVWAGGVAGWFWATAPSGALSTNRLMRVGRTFTRKPPWGSDVRALGSPSPRPAPMGHDRMIREHTSGPGEVAVRTAGRNRPWASLAAVF